MIISAVNRLDFTVRQFLCDVIISSQLSTSEFLSELSAPVTSVCVTVTAIFFPHRTSHLNLIDKQIDDGKSSHNIFSAINTPAITFTFPYTITTPITTIIPNTTTITVYQTTLPGMAIILWCVCVVFVVLLISECRERVCMLVSAILTSIIPSPFFAHSCPPIHYPPPPFLPTSYHSPPSPPSHVLFPLHHPHSTLSPSPPPFSTFHNLHLHLPTPPPPPPLTHSSGSTFYHYHHHHHHPLQRQPFIKFTSVGRPGMYRGLA